MPLPRRVEEGSLVLNGVNSVDVSTQLKQFAHDVEPIVPAGVVERSLPVDVRLVELNVPFDKVLEGARLAVPANVEEDGLHETILEVGVGPFFDEELRHSEGLFVVGEEGGEVEGRLPGLGLEPVDELGPEAL